MSVLDLSGTVLAKIVARTAADLKQRRACHSAAELEARCVPAGGDFAASLRRDAGVSLIAEFKPRSPSRGDLRPGAQVEDLVSAYAPYASAISVLCDVPFFGGGFDQLSRARAAVDLLDAPPALLCKDFVIDRYQVLEARAHGADAVLLMATVLDDSSLRDLLAEARRWNMQALVEVHDAAELDRALELDAPVIGVNSRDLKTLQIHRPHMLELLAAVPADRVKVAESGVSTAAHRDALDGVADAALVGSSLMAAADPAAQIRALGWTPRAPECSA